jgi:Flp pilus assembly protein TadG
MRRRGCAADPGGDRSADGAGAGDEGMVSAFVVVFAMALVFVTALVVDGGRMLAAHRQADNLADSAARAGAQAISEEAVRRGDTVIVDPVAAQAAACSFLANAGSGCGGGTFAVADGNRVTVTLHDTVDLMLLPGGSRPLTAEGTACVAVGITDAAPC